MLTKLSLPFTLKILSIAQGNSSYISDYAQFDYANLKSLRLYEIMLKCFLSTWHNFFSSIQLFIFSAGSFLVGLFYQQTYCCSLTDESNPSSFARSRLSAASKFTECVSAQRRSFAFILVGYAVKEITKDLYFEFVWEYRGKNLALPLDLTHFFLLDQISNSVTKSYSGWMRMKVTCSPIELIFLFSFY